jgi:hypothetical protein
VVASTATIRRAPDQVKAACSTATFTFFPRRARRARLVFALQRDHPAEQDTAPGRRYLGICAPGRRYKQS